ncbi:MAG TPA: 50S ribosomal protein L25, partial [Candidatus Omnitrophota bacterium]|nr:50S ribosomal protein L25 [Candidatus Omnitrophota bacterium]
MEQIQLKAVLREGTGKEAAKKLRGTGFVPAIVYHRGEEAVSIALVDKEITRIVNNAAGENILINLTIEKEKKPRNR